MTKLEKLYMAIGIVLTTLACIHEAHADTVMHVMVYNVEQHLDALIVDGAIFREPIIIGYGHKVAV